ncbi:hypothetical protein [Corynebacterium sp. DNF00584]|uniref:hypothetical protein n=1 Tax=Corynebacterium sp. DNF00584 TaxID=1384076 RepID=UPI00079924FA|nr:hypothetical protein [Corynebacterium sp. DNF00584]KXB52762.1 hypothetical protein HMPREF0307_02080 [Corynebacterium sp. DNF00584]
MKTIDLRSLGIDEWQPEYEVKGVFYHQDTAQKMVRANRLDDFGRHNVRLTVVPEPDNPHGDTALSVRWNDNVLGYISKDDSPNYRQLRRIAASGFDAETWGSLTIMSDWSSDDDEPEYRYSATVQLPDANRLFPMNQPPEGRYTLLPTGSAIQVTNESNYYEHLLDYVPESGEGLLIVTLHVEMVGVRQKREGVVVELDGSPIGELSKASSEKYITAIKHLNEQGVTVACMAKIKGSSVAAEVTLHAKKAHELTEDELNPTGFDAFPTLVPFQADPDAYDAPDRYKGEESSHYSTPKPASAPASNTIIVPLTSTPAAAESDAVWESLLTPDGTKRANLWQRGYARAVVGKSTGKTGPRIDYATVGQCKDIVAHFGGDVAEVDKRGSALLKFMWWLLVGMLVLVGLIFLVAGLWQVPALIAAPFVHHYWSRSRLKPPFGKQG